MADAIDLEVTELVKGEQLDAAATKVLEAYGSELYGFLVNMLGNEGDAAEVFSQAAEDLWKGLPKFGFRCSLRTWIYVLGRHAASRFKRSPWNKGERRRSDSLVASLANVARSRTQPWLRTEIKDRFQAIRESLDEEDRTLLTLRIDRDMAWEDVARVTLEQDEPDKQTLTRETDRLRKRFQLLKGELRKKAQEAGLLDENSSRG
jgi:RNA polymerase sigma-70 factor (ECF subfamily)